MIKENAKLEENVVTLLYKFVDNLLYFDDDERDFRLCISIVMKAEVFKFAHNEMNHSGYARTHERFTQGFYIHNMIIKFHEFIRYCFHCQLNQTPRHKFYDSLQSIFFSVKPFYTLTIDFILALFKSFDGEDCVIDVIDKFFKTITFIADKTTWDNKK